MDPAAVFNALHDTKCLKFGHFDLKSGLVAPYYMNLRRLPLYPALMDAIVTQVLERFLSPRALPIAVSQVRKRRDSRSASSASQLVESIDSELRRALEVGARAAGQLRTSPSESCRQRQEDTDSDSQLGEEEGGESGSDASGEWTAAAASAASTHPIISGVPYGAVPLAAAIAYKAGLPFLFERKAAKDYGDQQGLMEDFDDGTRCGAQPAARRADPAGEVAGDTARQHQVILIEDVICSGESIFEAVERLERQNLRVEFVICIVDREENGTNLLLQRAGIRVLSLYKISAILRVLEATGRISSKQFINIRQWIGEHQFRTIGVDPTERAPDDGDVRRPDTLVGEVEAK